MTQFGQALATLIDRHGASLRDLEARTGIDHTTLSRLVKDQRPSRSQLAALCAQACEHDSERYHLVFAHLSDEIAAAGLEPKRFSLRYAETLEDAPNESTPADLQADLAILVSAAVANSTLRSLLNDLAALVLQKSGSASPALLAVAEKPAAAYGTAGSKRRRRKLSA